MGRHKLKFFGLREKSYSEIARTKGDKILDTGIIIILLIIGAVVIYPLYFVLIASISNPVYIAKGEVLLFPKGVTLSGYMMLRSNKEIWIGYRNSLVYMVLGVLINLAVTLPCAYALSRKSLPFRTFFMMFFIFTMYFNGGLIPSYMLNKELGLINSIWVLVLPGALSVYNMIIARSFYANGIPEEIYESVRIDGAGNFRFFVQFALPLSTAMTAVIALYYALYHWTSYVTPMIYINNPQKQTLQVIIKNITASLDTTLSENMDPDELNYLLQEKQLLKYSVVLISSLPMLLLYPLIQRYFVKGVMIGAVKG